MSDLSMFLGWLAGFLLTIPAGIALAKASMWLFG